MYHIKEFNSAHFAEFLLESSIVPSGKEKFMVIWVGKFPEILRDREKNKKTVIFR